MFAEDEKQAVLMLEAAVQNYQHWSERVLSIQFPNVAFY